MGCKRYQKLIHLHRPGELSGRQANALERHLKHCRSCADVQNQMTLVEKTLGAARMNEPRIEDAKRLAERIFSSIETVKGNAHQETAPRFSWLKPEAAEGLRSLIGSLMQPGIARLAFAAMVATIVGAFFIQETTILQRISRLEKRMAAVPETGMESPYVTRMNGLRIHAFGMPVSRRDPADEEWVAVRKKDLKVLLDDYHDSRRLNGVLLDVIQKYRPEIDGIMRATKLDAAELEQFLIRNPEASRRFMSWLNSGGQI
jgi:hypothetical protein